MNAAAPRRTGLFVPGSSPRMLAKAATLGADELVLDLEDAVVPGAKPLARRHVVEALVGLLCRTAVRVNEVGSREVLDDVRDLVTAAGPPASLVLPKVESRDDVVFVDRLLLGFEQLTGRPAPRLQLLIETRAACDAIQQATGHDLETESGRYEARDILAAILQPWFASRDLSDVPAAFTGTGVSWGPHQTFRQLVHEDPRCSETNPMFTRLHQPGIGAYLAPRSPLDVGEDANVPVAPAPTLGQHTGEVLVDVLGLSGGEVADLFDRGIAAPTSKRAPA